MLKPEHFTAWQLNWQPKSENLEVAPSENSVSCWTALFFSTTVLRVTECKQLFVLWCLRWRYPRTRRNFDFSNTCGRSIA